MPLEFFYYIHINECCMKKTSLFNLPKKKWTGCQMPPENLWTHLLDRIYSSNIFHPQPCSQARMELGVRQGNKLRFEIRWDFSVECVSGANDTQLLQVSFEGKSQLGEWRQSNSPGTGWLVTLSPFTDWSPKTGDFRMWPYVAYKVFAEVIKSEWSRWDAILNQLCFYKHLGEKKVGGNFI